MLTRSRATSTLRLLFQYHRSRTNEHTRAILSLEQRFATEAAPLVREVCLGVIGCGRMGQFHVKAIEKSAKGSVGWIYDPAADMTQIAFQDHRTQILPSDQLHAALQSSPGDPLYVDGVLICSPTPFHPMHVEMCLKHHKPVLCEKPLTSDPAQLNDLFRLAKVKDTALRIGYQRVFDRDISQLIHQVQHRCNQHNSIPWSISMRTYDSPTAPVEYLRVCGPVFLDSMSHDFHVASSLLAPGDSIISAQAKEAPFVDANMGARSAAAIFRTAHNTLITSEFHRVSQIGYDNTIDVTFPDKMYRLQSRPRFTLTEGDGAGVLCSADYDTGFITKYENAYHTEIAAFLEEVAQNAPVNQHHMECCLSAMRMVNMAIESAQTGKEIHFKHNEE